MGCGCVNKELSTYERIRSLAVTMAKNEGIIYVVYRCAIGYNFAPIHNEKGEIVEYITPYCYDIRKIK